MGAAGISDHLTETSQGTSAYDSAKRRFLGAMVATVILITAGRTANQADQETPRCVALRTSFEDTKQRWTAHPHSKDAKADFRRAQAELLSSGCLKS
jgi:hypothetical protein